MGRPRQYASNAERQRAFRQRQEEQVARVDRGALDRLHARLDQLQAALWAAADAGDETARACRAAGIDTMLERLTGHFRGRARPVDPIAAGDGRLPAGRGKGGGK
jgi:hypothetical protein